MIEAILWLALSCPAPIPPPTASIADVQAAFLNTVACREQEQGPFDWKYSWNTYALLPTVAAIPGLCGNGVPKHHPPRTTDALRLEVLQQACEGNGAASVKALSVDRTLYTVTCVRNGEFVQVMLLCREL